MVLVDGENIFNQKKIEYLYSWRKKVNHVPQKIYLTNSNLVNNIALGISKAEIDLKKIKYSRKLYYEYYLLEQR